MKRLAVVLVLLAACGPSTPPADPANPGGSFDERQACTADTDCVAVEIECCEQCNGGNAVGIHRDYAAEVRQQYAPGDECTGAACTEMACEPATAFCSNSVCGLRFGDRVEVEPLPRP